MKTYRVVFYVKDGEFAGGGAHADYTNTSADSWESTKKRLDMQNSGYGDYIYVFVELEM